MVSAPDSTDAVAADTPTTAVLIVDDQADVRGVARRILEAAGLAVIEAADGREALDLLAGPCAEVNVVVTDLVMGEIGGAEIAEVLRIHRPDLPVLCMTGAASPRSTATLARLAIPVIGKPFDPSQFTAAVRSLLQTDPPGGRARGRLSGAGARTPDLVSEALRLHRRRDSAAS